MERDSPYGVLDGLLRPWIEDENARIKGATSVAPGSGSSHDPCADHQMFVDGDAQCFGGHLDLARHLDVVARRCRIAGRIIVHQATVTVWLKQAEISF